MYRFIFDLVRYVADKRNAKNLRKADKKVTSFLSDLNAEVHYFLYVTSAYFFGAKKARRVFHFIQDKKDALMEKMRAVKAERTAQKLVKALRYSKSDDKVLKLIKTPELNANYVDKKTGKSLLSLMISRCSWQKDSDVEYLFKALLQKGADLFSKNDEGVTPIEEMLAEHHYFSSAFKDPRVKDIRIRNKYTGAQETILTYLLNFHLDGSFIKFIIKTHPELLFTPNSKGGYPLRTLLADNKKDDEKFYGSLHATIRKILKVNPLSQDDATVFVANCLQRTDPSLEKILMVLKGTHGIDFGYKDENGNTFLHLWAKSFANYQESARKPFIEIFNILKQHISINAKNNLGQTPLMVALEQGQKTQNGDKHVNISAKDGVIGTLLQEPELDILAKDARGLMAYQYARVYPFVDKETFFKIEALTQKVLRERGMMLETYSVCDNKEIRTKIWTGREKKTRDEELSDLGLGFLVEKKRIARHDTPKQENTVVRELEM